MTQVLIGLVGRRGSGKSTVASMLRRHGFHEVSFADPLKMLCSVVFNVKLGELYGPSEARERRMNVSEDYWRGVHDRIDTSADLIVRLFADAPLETRATAVWALHLEVARIEQKHTAFITPRVILQRLGTDWGRAHWPKVWTSAGLRAAMVSGPRVVISDCRFPDEAKAVQTAGGEVWWIERPSVAQNDEASQHASEPRAEDFTETCSVFLTNDGTLERLGRAVDALVSPMLGEVKGAA